MNLELFAFPKLITYYISVLKLKLMFYNISQIVLSQSFHFLNILWNVQILKNYNLQHSCTNL